jgi:7,8-dihydropterin-6-yl-methyl-4-(beta-D-ribofuranosyl)aminobenzene 5'-phosphate synthase
MVTKSLHDKWRLDRIAPGHCTGEPAFAALQKAFGPNYVYAGAGSVIELR